MDPANWSKVKPNLPPDQIKALKAPKILQQSNIGIYNQDKSSRICFANLEKTNQKITNILLDATKYKILGEYDPAQNYQNNITNWYSKHKLVLKSIKEDVSDWITPTPVSTPHLRAQIKTHKQNCPIRLTFSSVGTVTRNLSTLLDIIYLKPSLATFAPCRLQDTI